ncbi:MAG: AAA family ATPase [Actinobacteria bacterium]|nr:AAA family ATPase [Actinomycetota bacterium]
MFLKNITLRGFKSFANKSQLIFEPGICVIVGPNGSGKSNVADAISWVLGEQRAKSLRGNSMEDVIFRNKKEELAIAEVSLSFDNSDNFLNLDFKEVKITRRVFVKGGSEYFINSSPCRLIDIQDLTAEQGIGKGFYTIINQGQVNDIAVLKPSDRKIIIDELIGVAKHKIRRDKSKNKLLKVSGDIERIDDLMHEVKRTLDPLEIESKKAQQYSEVHNNLKSEELSLFISELNELNKKWEDENAKNEENEIRLKEINQKIELFIKEKSQQQKNIYNSRSRYNYLKEKIDDFNLKENKASSMINLFESKKNVFSTLNNMLKMEYSSLKSSTQQISVTKSFNENKKSNAYQENAKFILRSFKNLDNKINEFFSKIKNYISRIELIIEFEKDKESIKKELTELMELIKKYIGSSIDSIDDGKKNIEITNERNKSAKLFAEIEKKLENIQTLENYCLNRVKDTEKILSVLNIFIKTAQRIKDRLYPEYKELYRKIEDEDKSFYEFDNKINDARIEKQNIDNELFKINFTKQQIKENVTNKTEAVVDAYNLPVEYIFKNYKPCEDIEKTSRIVRRLKNEIKNFGSINPNATIEFNRVKERYDFLQSQRDDLFNSKKNLELLINDINKKIEELFAVKFEEINNNFKTYFKILFPIGEGRMNLINSDNNSGDEIGIDMKVDIGNNKLVQLSLLSGGEKALISIAFLFSIFASNIAPFYVFDEIDAALDDMNLNRFIALVKKFSSGRQVIIITHQKKTMEVANTIYGVTMQSTGVSKIVSEKMEKIHEKAIKESKLNME